MVFLSVLDWYSWKFDERTLKVGENTFKAISTMNEKLSDNKGQCEFVFNPVTLINDQRWRGTWIENDILQMCVQILLINTDMAIQ
jgi:hypothetical protein